MQANDTPTKAQWLFLALLEEQRRVFQPGRGWTIQSEHISDTLIRRCIGKIGRTQQEDSGVWVTAQYTRSGSIITGTQPLR